MKEPTCSSIHYSSMRSLCLCRHFQQSVVLPNPATNTAIRAVWKVVCCCGCFHWWKLPALRGAVITCNTALRRMVPGATDYTWDYSQENLAGLRSWEIRESLTLHTLLISLSTDAKSTLVNGKEGRGWLAKSEFDSIAAALQAILFFSDSHCGPDLRRRPC